MGFLSWFRPKSLSLPIEIHTSMTDDERVQKILSDNGVMLAEEFNAICKTNYARQLCRERLAKKGVHIVVNKVAKWENGKFSGRSITYSLKK